MNIDLLISSRLCSLSATRYASGSAIGGYGATRSNAFASVPVYIFAREAAPFSLKTSGGKRKVWWVG